MNTRGSRRTSRRPTTAWRVSALILDRKLRSRAPNYLFQCGLATISLIIIFLVEDVLFRAAIVAAVASTTFIIFDVPNSVAATPRKVIGGHFVAVICGAIFSSVLLIPAVASGAGEPVRSVMAALSVGLGIFLMAVTDTEHAPAAGTALGLVVHGWTWSSVVFILSGAVILSLIRLALRPKLINLL